MEFQTALERFLQFCSVERRLSHHTISAYSFDLLDFKKWLSPDKSLEDVTEEDLKRYLEDMVSSRNLSVATVRRRLAVSSRLLSPTDGMRKNRRPIGNWRPKLPRRRLLPGALLRGRN